MCVQITDYQTYFSPNPPDTVSSLYLFLSVCDSQSQTHAAVGQQGLVYWGEKTSHMHTQWKT